MSERMAKASMGPAQSRSWKPGKRTTPIFVGMGEEGDIVGVKCK